MKYGKALSVFAYLVIDAEIQTFQGLNFSGNLE